MGARDASPASVPAQAKDWECPDPSAPSMRLKWKDACAPDSDLGDLMAREAQHLDAQTMLIATARDHAPAPAVKKREAIREAAV